jgi:hypothetical protein
MNADPSKTDPAARPHPRQGPSFWLWVLVLAMLGMALWGVLRLQQAVFYRQILAQLPVGVGYVAATGAFFALAGLLAAASILLRAWWAPWLARGAALLYAGWYWVDVLTFSRSGTALTNWPFSLGATIVGLLFVFGLLARERERRYFRPRRGSRPRKGNDEPDQPGS